MVERQIAIKHGSGPAEYSRYYFISSEVLYAQNEEIRIKLTFNMAGRYWMPFGQFYDSSLRRVGVAILAELWLEKGQWEIYK